MLTQAINSVKTFVSDTASTAKDYATRSVQFAGKKFEDVTNAVLGETAGKIVRKVAFSLPAAAAYTYAPVYVKGLALAGYLAAHVVYDIAKKSELPLSKNIYGMLTTAVGVSHLYMAAREALKAVAKQALNPVVATLVHVGIASFMISKAAKAPVPTFGSYGQEPVNPKAVPTETTTVLETAK